MRAVPGFFLLFAVVVALQWNGGAFEAEFAAGPDEPAHYITGLMVGDYIASGMREAPMRYAENYYLHYPKVALGHWPPLYYLVQAAWTLLFTPSRASLLLLQAALTALLAVALGAVVESRFSKGMGLAACVFFVCLPQVQMASRHVTPDILASLFVFVSFVLFIAFAESGRTRDSVLFGLAASLTILTSGIGFQLALLPPFFVLFSRRFGWLRRPVLWLPLVVVALITLPWYLMAPGARHESVSNLGGAIFAPVMSKATWWDRFEVPVRWIVAVDILPGLLEAVGVLLPLAVFGMWYQRRSREGFWTVAFAVVAAVLAFRVLVLAAGANHRSLLGLIPILVLFAAQGVHLLPRGGTARWSGIAAFALLLALNVVWMPPVLRLGFSEAAQSLLAEPQVIRPVMMIASDAVGEGAFIAEVAMRENRPGHYVLRGTKVLANSSWTGFPYKSLVHSTEDVWQTLKATGVGILVVDWTANPLLHDKMLRRAVLEYPERFHFLKEYRAHRLIKAYRLTTDQLQGVPRLKMRVPGLGRDLATASP